MRPEERNLVAQVACQINIAVAMGWEPELIQSCQQLYCSYLDRMLNSDPRRDSRADAADKMTSLRDDLSFCLARHGWTTVEAGGGRYAAKPRSVVEALAAM